MINEENRIWWIGGGMLVLALLLALYTNRFPSPGQPGEAVPPKRPTVVTDGSAVDGRRTERDSLNDRLSGLQRPGGDRSKRAPRPLASFADPTSQQCLEALASSPLEADRMLAARLLGRRANEEGLAEKAVDALIHTMDNDAKPQVWLVSARALGNYGADAAEAVPSLMKWIDHHTMGDIAIEALGGIGPDAEPAIEPIAQVASDDQIRFSSRSTAIEALVKIGGSDHPLVASVLKSATGDPDRRIGLAARHALENRLAAETQPAQTP